MTGKSLLKVTGLPVSEILPDGQIFGAEEIWFSSCTSDSRACRSGDIFVAIIGDRLDGHTFIDEAVRQGAQAIIAERLIPSLEVPLYIVPDSRVAYAELCHALAGFPSRRLNVIGVTGTHGKTTTTCLIQSIIKMAGLHSGVLNTLGYCDGQRTSPAVLSTPGAAVMADYLAKMRAGGCTHAVVEFSSRAIATRRTVGVELDVACVTHDQHGHVDSHDTTAQIFEQLRPEGLVVLNADDDKCAEYQDQLPNPVLTIGMRRPAAVTAMVLERVPSEQTFLLQWGTDTIPVRTHIIGDHHIYNCLAAAAVGLAYGVDLATIVRGLENVDEIPGQLQRIECGQKFQVFVDNAHTPEALENSLRTLREVTSGRLICVFGAAGNRDREKRPRMGETVAMLADASIVTDDNPRNESSSEIVEGILRGMQSAEDVLVEFDRASAIEIAIASADEGDCVLIAGRGHESWQILGNQRLPLDDREVARHCLRGTSLAWGEDEGQRAA